MKQVLKFAAFGLLFVALPVAAQVPVATHVAILKAEDSRDYDGLKPFIFSKNLKVQERAVLAAARIGEGSSVDALAGLLENGDPSIRPVAAFALGETEAEHAAVFILRALSDSKTADAVRARAVEAAGKIAAANPKDNDFKALGTAILDVLNAEAGKGKAQNRETILLGLTAVLRARPEGADVVTAKFLTNPDAAIRTSAGNTMARLRGKNANATLRSMLVSDTDPSARANAARALGAAEDKEAADLLLEAAIGDSDSRVRVSAIRSLGSLKDQKAIELLLKRGRALMEAYPKSILPNPSEKNELLEIVQVLGKILAASHDRTATMFLLEFQDWDAFQSQETEVALAQVAPEAYIKIESRLITGAIGSKTSGIFLAEWKLISGKSIGLKELAASKNKEVRDVGMQWLQDFLKGELFDTKKTLYSSFAPAIPDVLRAYAAYKPNDLNEALLENLKTKDAFVRSAAAELLAEQPVSKESTAALKTAFAKALQTDKHDNDAQLAILSALVKLDKNEAKDALKLALDAPDYLVRRHAAALIKENDLAKGFPGFENKVGPVRKYDPKNGTKLGQILNTDADYRRAIARKNGSVKAVFTTEKGNFTIDLFPEDAPLTVDNFIKLGRAKYFNGLEVHRVVPNFVMQDGDPRGDGNGGPGWSIRCEVNMLPYNRGSVGMALSGKDTGGSQWFVTHAAQPHLDGGYTVFGRVNEADMKVVDNIVRGDKIISVRIIGR